MAFNPKNSRVGRTYQQYEKKSRTGTHQLAKKLGYWCSIYFPVYSNPTSGDYDETNIFATHENASYSDTPDAEDYFYIPDLMKKLVMNSPSIEMENFFLDGDDARPFIEVHPEDELPVATKIKVYILEDEIVWFFVEKKIKTPGSVYLRMYLDPVV